MCAVNTICWLWFYHVYMDVNRYTVTCLFYLMVTIPHFVICCCLYIYICVCRKHQCDLSSEALLVNEAAAVEDID